MVRSMWLSRWSCSSTECWNSRSSICCSALRSGCGEPVFPAGGVVGEGDVGAIFAATTLPLVLGHVYGDAVEVGGDEGLAAKAGKGAVEAEEDVLGEVVEVLAGAGEAQEGTEDHVLMVVHDLLEGEIGVQAGLDRSMRLKFHRASETLAGRAGLMRAESR